MIYKNKNFIKRDYECTNVVFCEAEKAPNDNYILSSKEELEKTTCKQLFIENNVKYFGWL